MTNLETVILKSLVVDTANPQSKEIQARLDEITPTIIKQLSPQDILEHMKEVYNLTVNEYLANSHKQMVVDELLEFMAFLPESARVLDIGCGTGRDALFMSSRNRSFRLSLMQRVKNGKKTSEKYSLPTTAFRVVGLDQSEAMIAKSKETFLKLETDGVIFSYEPQFLIGNMHSLPALDYFGGERFSGIWSCTALFTHTPHSLIQPSLHQISEILTPNGIFSISYTNGKASGQYDKLLLSSTGRVKYFSQPNPEEISEIAKKYNLILEHQGFADMEVNGQIKKKDLFVSQLFRKKS